MSQQSQHLNRKTRALLENYVLASKQLTEASGERLAREAGQSVEFEDFRPYQQGDELRYVDWKVYGRTGKIYTRLYRAERNISVQILLDSSLSMSLGDKGVYARALAQALSFAARYNASTSIHYFNGSSSIKARSQAELLKLWEFIATQAEAVEPVSDKVSNELPNQAIKDFAVKHAKGNSLVIIISDFFDPEPLKQALTALKARRFDVSFLQVLSQEDFGPQEGQLELKDIETGEVMQVGPEEVKSYRDALQAFLERTRKSILGAGFRYSLLKVPSSGGDVLGLEQNALKALIAANILIRK